MRGNQRYYCLKQSEFEKHLRYLRDHGFKSIAAEGDGSHDNKPVMLTFDDGLQSHFICYQLLLKYRLTGVFFIVTDWVGSPGYLTWEQIKEMDRQGMDIQSHTCSHPILTTLDNQRLLYEFKVSREVLTTALHRDVTALSIPQGFADSRIIDMAVNCGYRYIFTSEPGTGRLKAGCAVNRLTIFNRTTYAQFKRLVRMNQIEILKQTSYKKILSLPKTVLGDDTYHRIRTGLLKKLT